MLHGIELNQTLQTPKDYLQYRRATQDQTREETVPENCRHLALWRTGPVSKNSIPKVAWYLWIPHSKASFNKNVTLISAQIMKKKLPLKQPSE